VVHYCFCSSIEKIKNMFVCFIDIFRFHAKPFFVFSTFFSFHTSLLYEIFIIDSMQLPRVYATASRRCKLLLSFGGSNEETGEESCLFHRLLALQPQIVEHYQRQEKKAVYSIDFSHSSRKSWSTINNLLAGLDPPLVCAPYQQTPSPHSSCRTGHIRP